MSDDSRPTEVDLEVEAAAYLWAKHFGRSDTNSLADRIARDLGYDVVNERNKARTKVSRLMKAARKTGAVRLDYVPSQSKRGLEVQARFSGHCELGEVLREYSHEMCPHRDVEGQAVLKNLIVVDRELPADSASGFDQNLRVFSEYTDVVLNAALSTSRMAAVAWGRTLNRIIEHATSSKALGPPADGHPRRVIPLWGDEKGPAAQEEYGLLASLEMLSSTYLAAKLQSALNQALGAPVQLTELSLQEVPVLVPLDLRDRGKINSVVEYFKLLSDWGEIFGDWEQHLSSDVPSDDVGRPLIYDVDTMILSAGSSRFRGRFMTPAYLGKLLGDPKVVEWLLESVHGDIGGCLQPLAAAELTLRQRDLLCDIAAHWPGVREKHLRHCSQMKNGNRGAGVVVFAVDVCRRDVLLHGIKGGLINHLCVPADLARSLVEKARVELDANA